MKDGSVPQSRDRVRTATDDTTMRSIGGQDEQPRTSTQRPAYDLNGNPARNGTDQSADLGNGMIMQVSSAGDAMPEIQNCLTDGRVGLACQLTIDLLDNRVSAGDTELLAAKSVVRLCLSLIETMPPLSHVASLPLRPDDRLYAFFDQFLSLLRQQESQMDELQAMISDLI